LFWNILSDVFVGIAVLRGGGMALTAWDARLSLDLVEKKQRKKKGKKRKGSVNAFCCGGSNECACVPVIRRR